MIAWIKRQELWGFRIAMSLFFLAFVVRQYASPFIFTVRDAFFLPMIFLGVWTVRMRK